MSLNFYYFIVLHTKESKKKTRLFKLLVECVCVSKYLKYKKIIFFCCLLVLARYVDGKNNNKMMIFVYIYEV